MNEWIEYHYSEICRNAHSYLYAILRNRGCLDLENEIEDCIQDAFLEACKHRDVLERHPNRSGWILVTARNKLLHRIEKNGMRMKVTPLSLDEAIAGDDHSIENYLAYRSFKGSEPLEQMLDTIRGEIGDEAFLFLVDHHDLSAKELAKKNRSTVGAVKMRAKRLVDRLRKASFSLLLHLARLSAFM